MIKRKCCSFQEKTNDGDFLPATLGRFLIGIMEIIAGFIRFVVVNKWLVVVNHGDSR